MINGLNDISSLAIFISRSHGICELASQVSMNTYDSASVFINSLIT